MVPVDLLFLVDISGSMEESAGAQSKWVALRDALQTFVQRPEVGRPGRGTAVLSAPQQALRDGRRVRRAAGVRAEGRLLRAGQRRHHRGRPATTSPACPLGVGRALHGVRSVRPHGPALHGHGPGLPRRGRRRHLHAPAQAVRRRPDRPAAWTASYETPVVPIGDLPSSADLDDRHAGHDHPPGRHARPRRRSAGALTHLRARAMANPGRKPVLVAGHRWPAHAAASPGNTAVPAAGALSAGPDGHAPGQHLRDRRLLPGPARPGHAHAEQPGHRGRHRQPVRARRPAPTSASASWRPSTRSGARPSAASSSSRRPRAGPSTSRRSTSATRAPTGAEDLRYVASSDRCDPARGGWYYDVDPARVAPPACCCAPRPAPGSRTPPASRSSSASAARPGWTDRAATRPRALDQRGQQLADDGAGEVALAQQRRHRGAGALVGVDGGGGQSAPRAGGVAQAAQRAEARGSWAEP